MLSNTSLAVITVTASNSLQQPRTKFVAIGGTRIVGSTRG